MMARNSGDFPKTLSKDANPIALLMDLKDVLNGHIASLKDNTLITLSNMKLDKIIQMDISHAKATLEFCSRYIATFMEKVEELSLVLIATVRKLTDKLSKEFEDFVSDPDGRQMTEKELEMLMGNTKVFKDFSEMAAVLAALQEMTAKIHEAAGKVAVELFQKRQEAENARAVVEALEEEMQIKANEERKQKEQEKQLMEEERKRKEEEERKRLEEEERRRVEEEEERRHVEEEEKRRRVEEEEKRRRVEEEEKRRRVEEEEERRRVEEEEKRRRVEEEEERRRVEEEEERRRVEEEEERRHLEEEEKRRRVEEEEKRRRVEEEEKRRRVEEEEERRRVEEEEKRRRVEEEEERRRVEEEEERRRVEEEEKRRRVEEEEERRRVEEEEKRRRVEEEEERRRVEEEEERRRVEEEEQRKREEKEERLRQEAEDMKRKEEDERLKREEEARKRREQEEKLKQEQEEAKRKKEKEERDRLEEEKRQRKNPANWPIFIYKVQDNDNTGTGIGCVIRAPAGNMQEADVTVSVADQVTSSFALGENEELVSNLIHIKVNRSDNFFFEFAPLLALPDCKEAAPYARETVIKICTDGVTWSELPSTDVKIPGLMEQRKLRLVEASINSLCTMTVAAVSKPKSTWEEITSWGKQIIWQVDKRVNITIPKQAVRLKATMGLQVQPIPLSTIASVRNEGVTTQNLMASTPLVSVESDGKFQKPVRVSVPTPRSNTSRASTSMVGRATRSAPSGNEQTFLAWRLQGKDWQHANAVELVQQADSYIFDLNMQAGPCRFILLKLEGAKPSDVPDIAEKLETAMRQREVNIILCQKSTDMHSAVIDVCSTEKADTVLNTFTEQGFDVGPLKSETLVIHEGQIIEVKFSGNITKDAEHDICFAFNSNLTSAKRQFHLKAKDQYAQHGQSLYRGYAEFWTPGIDTRIQQTVRVDRWGSEHQVTHEEERRLNFLPLTLPRVTRKSYVKKASNSFAAEGILTEQYLEHLSTVLVDDWVHLAKELGVQKSKLRPHEGPQSTERTIKDMLVMWYKGTAISADKVGALLKALRKVGRDDLAQELDERNNPLPSDTIEEAKLTKAFKSVLASPDALERWRFLARSLEVSEAIITDLRVTNGNSLINQCDAMLRRWKEMKGQGATRVVLQKALRECGMLKTAEDVLEM